jgi:hypothetical protein
MPTPTPSPTDPDQLLHQLTTDTCGGGLALRCTAKAAKDKLEGAGASVFNKALDVIASAITDGVRWILHATLLWWIDSPVQVSLEKNQTSIERMRGYLAYMALAVLVGGLMVQGIRMSIQRRVDPAVQAARGLVTYAVTAGAGTTAVFAADAAASAFAKWVLDTSTDGQFTKRMAAVLTFEAVKMPPGAIIPLGIIAMLVSVVQAVLMLLREAALLILTGTLVLAASGTVTRSTEGWFPRVIGWTVAMILYKPTAALVFAAAFTLVGEGQDPASVFIGLTMMVLSIFALPVLMKLFSWVGGEVGGGSGSGMLMNAAMALQGLASMRGGGGGGGGGGAAGGWSAAQQAAHMMAGGAGGGRGRPALPSGHGPGGPGGGPPPPPPPPGGGPGRNPGGAAPTSGPGAPAGGPSGAAAGGPGGGAGAAAGAAAQGVRAAGAAAQAGAGAMTPPDTGGPGGGSPPAGPPGGRPALPAAPPPGGPRRRPLRSQRPPGVGGE